jgi:hypothetical protein
VTRSRRLYVVAYVELALGVAWLFTPWRGAVAAVWLLSVITQWRTEVSNAKTERGREDAGRDETPPR